MLYVVGSGGHTLATWHVGRVLPVINGVICEIQADCDELVWVVTNMPAMKEKGERRMHSHRWLGKDAREITAFIGRNSQTL